MTTTSYECPVCGAVLSSATNHTCASGRITVLSTGPAVNKQIISIDDATRDILLRRMMLAIVHTERAADRGDRGAINHHRGYRKGVADTMALLMGDEWAHTLKIEAYQESRKDHTL